MIDHLFLLAIGAFGWGLSLASYRFFAGQNKWPMGALQADLPAIPVIIGLVSVLIAIGFAGARGAAEGGWVIVVFGVLLAIFWTGFLRVGSQISLVLAPAAAVLLTIVWLATPIGYEAPEGESGAVESDGAGGEAANTQ